RRPKTREAIRGACAVGRVHLNRQGTHLVRVRGEGEQCYLALTMVGMRSMPGNPYDRLALLEMLGQMGILADQKPTTAVVEKAYRGVQIEGVRIMMSGYE
ncbi:MAG: hypothetical protein ABIR84_00100, partial [Candidatus Nitrotoga sp.]